MIISQRLRKLIAGLILLLPFISYGQNSDSAPNIRLHQFSYEAEYSVLTADGELADTQSVFRADSGSFLVPENRRALSTRTIPLPLIRILSTGDEPKEPVFWLSGGPGQTNLRSFHIDYFIGTHDHVMVGYRGVDGEVSLDCPEINEILEEGGDILTEEVIDTIENAYGACAGRLQRAGVDINGYTPIDVVDDLEDARKALGYSAINLVGESFGTRIAYLYALRYPQNVHRMILIGANPPGRMVWDPAQADSMLVRYGRLWNQDPLASQRYPDLVDAIRRVNNNMPDRWLIFPIHEGTAKASAFTFLFQRESAATIFDAYAAAANGDASGLWLVSMVSEYIWPGIVNWGDNASKAVSADFDSTRDYFHELTPEGAIMGAPMGSFLWGPTQRRTWPISLMPAEYRIARPCSVSTLILNGSLDFSTPFENTDTDLLPLMPNATHIVLSEMGHVGDLWRVDPASSHRILTSFLETGVADTSLVRYVPMSFEVGWGLPVIAKLFVGGACLAGALVVVLLYFIIRRIRRWIAAARPQQ